MFPVPGQPAWAQAWPITSLLWGLGKNFITFPSLTFYICTIQIVVRIKLDRAHKMFGAVPRMSVKKVGTGIIILVPALPLIHGVILGKFLPLPGPESPHAPSSLWFTTRSQRCCRAGDLETNNGLLAHLGFAFFQIIPTRNSALLNFFLSTSIYLAQNSVTQNPQALGRTSYVIYEASCA